MDKDSARKEFRRVYPEDFIHIIRLEELDEAHVLLGAEFPDGTFYFIISEHSVSSSFNTIMDAKRSVN